MKGMIRVGVLFLIVLLGLCGHIPAQIQTGRPKQPSIREQQPDELADMKDDLAKMQSSLNQMQAVFALVGNPTSPANHELELNIDMWRTLIKQMQRHVEQMEQMQPSRPTR
jgi:hypothetical protein